MTMTNPRRSMLPAVATIASLLAAAPFAATIEEPQRGRAQREQPATPSDMGLHGYSVVLVIGDMQGSGTADTVPTAARKALTDMQAFLPYKRYQLLDAAWMICCGAFRSPLSGRVRGPDNGEYVYSIETLNPADETKLTVRFSMRDATGTSSIVGAGSGTSSGGGRGSARGSSSSAGLSDSARLEHSRQLYEAIRDRDEAEVLARSTRQKHEVGLINPTDMEVAQNRYRLAQRRVEDLQHLAGGGSVSGGRGGGSGRSVMDSTFSIALGETVVIGTSRLKGDQALIALLTAARKPAK
jgi:hypothetical protein